MAIQQLDLGAVYNTLAQQRALGLQEQQVGQQGQMNALQMARYQRENDLADKKQSAISTFSDPNATPEQKQSALRVAYPEMFAQSVFAPKGETQVVVPSGAAVFDRSTNQWTYPDQGPVLEGDPARGSQPPQQPRPTITTGGHGPVPMPVERQPLGVQMASSESGGRPGIVNKQGYSGKYQFGEAAAAEAGFYEPDDNPNDNKWNGKFKGLNGVNSYQDFLGNEAAQDQAFGMHQTHLDAEIEGRGLKKYIGQTIGGVPVTRDALAGMMHIGGPAGTQKFLESGGKYNPGDSNGTRISDYGKKFAGDQGGVPAASQVDQHVIQVLGPELAGKVFAAEKANPNALLTDVMPPEWVQQHPEAKGVTIAQRRQQIESQFTSNAQQAPQQAGDDGWLRVRNLKSAGISQDAPPGMMWVGRRRPDGSIETKVAPMPGVPDDRASKQASETFDQETKLRTEHQNIVKGFDVAQTNYATMPELAADATGGSDIALVNAFYKTFAPDSTVMEGEFAQAGRAAGLPDRIVGLFEKAMTGQVLTGDQRQELIKAAGRFYDQRKASVEGANDRYTKLAQSYPGVNAERVVINPIRDLPKYEPKPKAETKVADVTSMSNDDLLRNLGIGK